MIRYILTYIIIITLIPGCHPGEHREHNQEEHAMNNTMNENSLHLTNQQIMLGNIATDTLSTLTLDKELLLNAVVSVNENTTLAISSRVMGRIVKLFVKNTGELINKGELLYEINSDDINLAIRELLMTIEKSQTLTNTDIDLQQIAQKIRNKLRLYGLTEEQIRKIEREKLAAHSVKIYSQVSGIVTAIDITEGSFVMEGATLYHATDLTSVWIEIQVDNEDRNSIAEGLEAEILIPGIKHQKLSGKISFFSPELNVSGKINPGRIEVENKMRLLKPGMQAIVKIVTDKQTKPFIPTDAIISDSKGSSVWVCTGRNMFESRMVTTGIESNGYTEILSGLDSGSVYVKTGAYLLNSEYIFKKGMNPMEGHDMSQM